MKLIKKFFDKLLIRYYLLENKIRGLDFEEIPVNDLGLDESKIKRNSASSNSYLRKCIKNIKIKPNDSILDIGSSKGSVLRLFSNFEFNKIDGIEISDQLTKIALSNLKKISPETNIYIEDAKLFKSYGKYNFFYIYNSFYPEDLRIVLNAIINQTQNIIEILIIYNNPRESTLKVLKEFKDLFIIAEYAGKEDHRILILSTNKDSNRIKT